MATPIRPSTSFLRPRFRLHMTDMCTGIGVLLYLSGRYSAFWPLGVGAFFSLGYLGSMWTKRGRRLVLPFRSPACPSWCLLEYPHRVLYHCPAESDMVAGAYESAVAAESVENAVGRVFRAQGQSAVHARERVIVWRQMAQASRKYLVFRRYPRMAAGWAQIHGTSAKQPENVMKKSTEKALCVLGLEPYLLGSAIVHSACTHELIHLAQQLDRNLLYREWHGKLPYFFEGLRAEWEALLFAKQLPWAGWVMFRTPLLALAVLLFLKLMP